MDAVLHPQRIFGRQQKEVLPVQVDLGLQLGEKQTFGGGAEEIFDEGFGGGLEGEQKSYQPHQRNSD
jgi:hypothetical protein